MDSSIWMPSAHPVSRNGPMMRAPRRLERHNPDHVEHVLSSLRLRNVRKAAFGWSSAARWNEMKKLPARHIPDQHHNTPDPNGNCHFVCHAPVDLHLDFFFNFSHSFRNNHARLVFFAFVRHRGRCRPMSTFLFRLLK